MKKFIAFLLFLFYISTNSCYAFSALYYIKGITTDDAKPVVESAFNTNRYNIVKQNPYYALSQAGDDSVVIILQQSGENMFYYYRSEDNVKVNKSVLKEIKKQGIVYEQSFNQNLIEIYDGISDGIISSSGAVKTYSFEEPDNYFTPPQTSKKQEEQQNVYSGYVARVESGTKIQCYLQNAINTATAAKGDNIIAVISSDLTYNGNVVAPQGSLIYGSLTTARPATYGSRNGRVVISFNKIVTPENKVYNIEAETIDFTVSNDGKLRETVKSAAGTAIAGALTGLLFALIAGSDHVARSVLIGAGAGAASSAVYSTAERGVDAEIPSFTEIELTLTQPFTFSSGN